MYPGVYAEKDPNKPAHIMARSGETVTYGELEARSCQLAQLMYDAGLRKGDHVAIFMENNPRYFEAYWAAIRSGLYFTTVNRYLSAEEAAYIIQDSQSRVVVTSAGLGDIAEELAGMIPSCPTKLMVDGVRPGYASYEDAIAAFPAEPLQEQPRGEVMLYSSGTTGRPKGIWRPLSGLQMTDSAQLYDLLKVLYSVNEDSIYLSPAPLYHAAPIGFSSSVQGLGGTVVVLEKFDALEALHALEKYKVTHSQWVPTMFSRMLKLPEADRNKFDLSSHEVAIHAAAPCPPQVKEEMIDWWGKIIYEYYGGTELNGMTFLNSEDWLTHRGSVGKPILGVIHVCDEEGKELPVGEEGIVYFELPAMPFKYHNADEKTKSAQHPEHPNWSALGDVGKVDEDGFLYLTDRKDFMIISGGVNIYPQEIENMVITHPKVLDVAVFGVPNPEFGEEVKAVVQTVEGIEGSPELAQELIEFCREHIATYKCPRSIDFEAELPRLPTGKLYKRILRDKYWGKHDSKIV
ncbi:MAG: AMP-binding protein [Pseudomonadota bacterium]